MSSFNADEYWKRHEKDCPYAEGNRCFIVSEPGDESCKGCLWYKESNANSNYFSDSPDHPYQFDNLTGSMNL